MISKRDKVLKYLKSGRLLTKLKSLRLFGLINTGNVIHRLRNQGYNIETTMVRSSKDEVYAIYRMRKLEQIKWALQEAG